ncbi:C2H2 finger domain-containing protein [Histoplasma capsulatum H143]|uniref:C2H2 finger domain-containing protein n=1 Tax=Ajellomyces capsulatus (strain H143) TaxID=544712 RepID=C6HCJ7_AJECH|nr:C2H2 finger domain-containing protein [Histoplasma capsulatum H143]
MPKRRHNQVISSNDGGTTDESSRMDMNSGSDYGYETELTEPDSDVPRDRRRGKRKRRQLHYRPSTSVPKKVVAAAATDDSDDDTDPEDDTDDEISSGDEDDDYSPGARRLIARMEDHWQRSASLSPARNPLPPLNPRFGTDRETISRYCRKKEAEPSAHRKWRDPIDALRAAGRSDLYRFFNWRFGLKLGEGRSSTEGDEQVELPEGRLEELPALLRGRDWQQGRCTADAVDAEGKSHSPIGRRLSRLIVVEEPSTAGQEAWAGHTGEGEDAGRDPSGGPHLPTVEFRYRFTKKHLGLTPTNTFILPEIIYEPSLILSPHNFLFGILFFFGAFKATNLTSMEKLRGLTIGGGRQQKPIPLKPEMADHYVFCKVTKEGGKVRILPEEKMDPSSAIRTIAEICGFLHPWFNHRCRYGGGLILNKSGLVGDAEQNLVLKHASIRTFLDHYIPRTVSINMQPLISGLEPNAPLMRAITRIGRWLDKRRPRHLTDAQKATVEQDPELQEVIQKRDRAGRRAVQTNSPGAIEKFARRKDDVKKTRNRLLYRYRKQVREEFDDEQAVIDIERQLSGMALDEEAKETLEEEQMLPAQIHLLSKLLTWPTSRSVEEELRRRDAGVEAVRMYCGVLEGGPRRGRRPKAPPPSPPLPPTQTLVETDGRSKTNDEVSPEAWSDALRAAEEHIRDAKQPRGCFECYAHPGSSDHRRIHRYSRPADLSRHFRDDHLLHLKDGEPAWCSWCEIKLEHKMHVQNHAKMVHRVHT